MRQNPIERWRTREGGRKESPVRSAGMNIPGRNAGKEDQRATDKEYCERFTQKQVRREPKYCIDARKKTNRNKRKERRKRERERERKGKRGRKKRVEWRH